MSYVSGTTTVRSTERFLQAMSRGRLTVFFGGPGRCLPAVSYPRAMKAMKCLATHVSYLVRIQSTSTDGTPIVSLLQNMYRPPRGRVFPSAAILYVSSSWKPVYSCNTSTRRALYCCRSALSIALIYIRALSMKHGKSTRTTRGCRWSTSCCCVILP